MAREYNGSLKPYQLDAKRRQLTRVIAGSGLCVLFYVLGAWQISSRSPSNLSQIQNRLGCDVGSTKNTPSTFSPLDFESHHQVALNESIINGGSTQKFQPCPMNFSEYTPCQDPNKARKFEKKMLMYRERHCPAKEDKVLCLIPAPPKYKNPFKWPKSRDYAWYDNIPHKELSIEKAVQNWIQVEGDWFRFPGGGTMFPRGADAYIDDINQLISLTNGKIRTALDTGCGVRSDL